MAATLKTLISGDPATNIIEAGPLTSTKLASLLVAVGAIVTTTTNVWPADVSNTSRFWIVAAFVGFWVFMLSADIIARAWSTAAKLTSEATTKAATYPHVHILTHQLPVSVSAEKAAREAGWHAVALRTHSDKPDTIDYLCVGHGETHWHPDTDLTF